MRNWLSADAVQEKDDAGWGLPLWWGVAIVALFTVAISLCHGPVDAPRAKDGDRVKVHYIGSLEDGEVFDSSDGREPLEFVVAGGQVIKGFDDAVRDLAVGETRSQRVEPLDGYGETDPGAILEIPLENLPEGVVAGEELFSQTGARAVVLSIDEEAGTAQIDTNHFLAGKVLIFDVELIEIVPGG